MQEKPVVDLVQNSGKENRKQTYYHTEALNFCKKFPQVYSCFQLIQQWH